MVMDIGSFVGGVVKLYYYDSSSHLSKKEGLLLAVDKNLVIMRVDGENEIQMIPLFRVIRIEVVGYDKKGDK